MIAGAEPVLDVRGLSLRARDDGEPERALLDDVSLRLGGGEVLGLVGESGAGKSLLAWAVLGLLPDGVAQAGGSIRFRGEPLEAMPAARRRALRGTAMSMVVQDAQSSLDPLRRVGRQLEQTLRLVGGRDARSARRDAHEWLDRVGLPRALAARYPHELSGGQAQRVVIALAMCAEPSLLVADEPTSALDPDNAARIAGLLRGFARERGGAVLLAAHDDTVLAAADRVVGLRGGRIVTSDPPGPAPPLTPPPRPGEPPAGAAPVLRFDRVGHAYGGAGALPALDAVSFVLHAGETLAILGRSGSGKSTTARIAAGLLRPGAGQVWRAPHRRGRFAAMVFQDARESLDPRWRVWRSVAEPIVLAGGADGDAARRRADELLALVGLPRATGLRAPDRLSGGEAQRAAVARALAGEPALLVCDEPTSALDASSRASLLGLLRALQRELGFAMLFTTHDAEAARAVAHRIAVLRDGRLVEEGRAGPLPARRAG